MPRLRLWLEFTYCHPMTNSQTLRRDAVCEGVQRVHDLPMASPLLCQLRCSWTCIWTRKAVYWQTLHVSPLKNPGFW